MRSLVFYLLIFILIIYIAGLLIENLEGFENPFEKLFKKLQAKKNATKNKQKNPTKNATKNAIKNKQKINTQSNNSFQEIINTITSLQQEGQAYDKWIGYIYKHAPNNSKLLDDFKARVFQPSCKFRVDWDTKPPKGMSIPTPAPSPQLANIAYKNYMECLTKGKPTCLQQLENARLRFMEPGTCQFLNPPDVKSYSNDYRVSFH
uniref:Uncharacterized protein n=1 Tax=viral metagenome TaxID=1070528 RepID=A0A6C0HEV4_9ZZZZ